MPEATTTTGKRTRINIVNDVTWDMCKGLSNVDPGGESMTDPAMLTILYNAARMNREWKFQVFDSGVRQVRFTIFAGSELLGSVVREHSSRGRAYIPHLHADRIASSRQRSRIYSHKEPAAILRKMREVVYPKTLEEKTEAALGCVSQGVYGIERAAAREHSTAQSQLRTAAIEFSLSPQGKEAFLQYEATFGTAKKRDTAGTLKTMADATLKGAFAAEMRTWAGAKYPIVARTQEGWYVKHDGVVKVYPDDELPEQYSNVRVLLLTQDKTTLPDIGIRIEESVYVIHANT